VSETWGRVHVGAWSHPRESAQHLRGTREQVRDPEHKKTGGMRLVKRARNKYGSSYAPM